MTPAVWREISSSEFAEALRDVARSAFRLELQPDYIEDYEQDLVNRFLSGEFCAPTEVPELAEWFNQVAEQVREGKKIDRVRVQETPPTPYQQLERWCDPWNVGAGESIGYITRPKAHEVGLLPTAGQYGDWWLIDSHALIVFTHDADGRRSQYRCTTDPAIVSQAAMWRDLAIQHSEPSEARKSPPEQKETCGSAGTSPRRA